MRRRSFLQLIGLTTVASALPGAAIAASGPKVAAGVAAPSSGSAAPSALRYRGRGGRILVSADSGQTWTNHANLGPMYSVRRITTDGAGGARATIVYRGRTFPLVLAPDLETWWSA